MQDVLLQIQELLRQNKKIEAIKIYRDATGAGLKEAKEIVEAVQMGRLPESLSNPPLASVVYDGDWQADALRLIQAGKKIEAIKVFREKTGKGLREAKEWADQQERSPPPPPPPSSFGGSIDALAVWWVAGVLTVVSQAAGL